VWKQTNWIGYVAVATDAGVAALGRRDIVVVWRGTVRDSEKENDVDVRYSPARPVLGTLTATRFGNPEVHRGFMSVYTAKEDAEDQNSVDSKPSAQDQVSEPSIAASLDSLNLLMLSHQYISRRNILGGILANPGVLNPDRPF
jgi:hypothetical protein